jgi:hypothetical protein
MRPRQCRLALVVIAALSAAGCSKHLDFTGNADAQGGAPGPEGQESTSWAANGADLSRFADEVPFGPDAVVARDKTQVRKAPGSGDVVTTLPGGTEVTKLSAHGAFDLVCFDDPKNAGTHLAGWVAQSALGDPAQPNPAPTSDAALPADDDAEPPPAPTPTNPSPSPPSPGGHHHHHHGPTKH